MPKRFMPVSWFFLLSLYFSHSASALVIIDYNAVYYGDPDPSWAASGELHIMGLRIDASLTEVLALGINDQLQVTGSYVQANKIEFFKLAPPDNQGINVIVFSRLLERTVTGFKMEPTDPNLGFSFAYYADTNEYDSYVGRYNSGLRGHVDEPATLALMGLGLAGIGYKRHRSKKAA